MRSILFLLVALFCLQVVACGKPEPKEAASNADGNAVPIANAKAPVEVGKVLQSQDGKYAYYLPKGYTQEKAAALMLFFDSHARGKDPLEKYQSLADQYETILVGSNVSRNGQQFPQSQQIYGALMAEMRQRFTIDEKRIATAGFSGGARVAAGLAQSHPEIMGVLGCAAGFQPQQIDRFNYMGFVGMEDFNYQEIRQLDEVLDQTTVFHQIEYFDGGHEWPPLNFMAKGFQFLQMRAMASGNLPKNDTLITNIQLRFDAQDKQLKNDYQRWLLRKHLIGYLDGLADLGTIKEAMGKLSTSADVALQNKRLASDFEKENAMRQQYVPKLGTASVEEWKKMTDLLRKVGTKGPTDEAWLHMRVLNFLSLNTYFQVDGALKAGDLAAAEHFNQIYALVDPENSEHAYLLAQIRMRQNNPSAAKDALKTAQMLGFNDGLRLAGDPVFASLANDHEFQTLLNALGK
jgi:pimeloyl-ACP methyl ester carboxylesterase